MLSSFGWLVNSFEARLATWAHLLIWPTRHHKKVQLVHVLRYQNPTLAFDKFSIELVLKMLTSKLGSSMSTWKSASLREEDLFAPNTFGSSGVREKWLNGLRDSDMGVAWQQSSWFILAVFIEILGAICGALNCFLAATEGVTVQRVKEGCNRFKLKMTLTYWISRILLQWIVAWQQKHLEAQLSMDTEIVCQHILLNKKLQMLFGRSSIEFQRCLWFQLVSRNFVLLHPPLDVSATKSVTPITWGKLKIFKYNRSFESAKLSAIFTSKGILLVGSTSPLAMAMASVWERFVLGIKVKTLWLLPYWEKNYVQQPNIRREWI
jgi:hypothetical protein